MKAASEEAATSRRATRRAAEPRLVTDPLPSLRHHNEAHCEVPAQPSSIFEYIDRPERLSAHMARRSWRLAGSSMAIETDADGGRSVGSHIHLMGRMLGIPYRSRTRWWSASRQG